MCGCRQRWKVLDALTRIKKLAGGVVVFDGGAIENGVVVGCYGCDLIDLIEYGGGFILCS